MIVVHFVDVGQGNMTLVEMPNGTIFLYDCNVTEENADRVLGYLGSALNGRRIAFFVNSHREADHMGGIKRVLARFPIPVICDNGEPGGTTNSPQYIDYMDARRNAQRFTVQDGQVWTYGSGRARVLNAANAFLADDPNAQSIVLKIENLNPATGAVANSVMLTGDSDAETWERWIVPVHGAHLPSTILLGSHHGADTFCTRQDGGRCWGHLTAIRPRMTVLSVGDNSYGHPDPAALRAYEAASTGSDQGMKIARTDLHGSIRVALYDDGSWQLTSTGPSPRPERPALPRRLGTTLLGGVPPAAIPSRPLPGRRPVRLTDLMIPPPRASIPRPAPAYIPPPPKSPLAAILEGIVTPPATPDFSALAKLIMDSAPPKKKTPEQEILEALLKQRPPWPPK
jgi:beta-lactamase superfamily II metal-dependent hydrolase